MHETESQVILNGSYDIGFTMDLALIKFPLCQILAVGWIGIDSCSLQLK